MRSVRGNERGHVAQKRQAVYRCLHLTNGNSQGLNRPNELTGDNVFDLATAKIARLKNRDAQAETSDFAYVADPLADRIGDTGRVGQRDCRRALNAGPHAISEIPTQDNCAFARAKHSTISAPFDIAKSPRSKIHSERGINRRSIAVNCVASVGVASWANHCGVFPHRRLECGARLFPLGNNCSLERLRSTRGPNGLKKPLLIGPLPPELANVSQNTGLPICRNVRSRRLASVPLSRRFSDAIEFQVAA